MTTQATIESKLKAHFSPDLCTVENETHMHNVPADSESHFKVTLVTDSFDGKMLVARHKMIYKLLNEELKNGVHALALHTYTMEEWNKKQGALASPPCLGGAK